MHKKYLISSLLLIAMALFFSLSPEASAADEAAEVFDVQGNAWLILNGQSQRQKLITGQTVHQGDLVITGSNGKAALLLTDESLIRLHHGSEFRLNTVAPVAGWLTSTQEVLKSSYELIKGELWFRNKRRQSDIKITTQHVSISVRGTEFSVVANNALSLVNMLEGKVTAKNTLGAVDAISGEQVVVERGKAPIKRLLLNPDDAVQWTIRLPSLFSTKSLFTEYITDQQQGTKEKALFNNALQYVKNGAYNLALDEISLLLTAARPSTSINLLQAWIYLETGELNKAEQLLASLTQQQPKLLKAWQLYSLTALANNDNGIAFDAASKAISLSSNSIKSGTEDATSLLLKSYALQSQFKLNQAARAAKQACSVDPRLISGWLQQAKLAIASGFFDKALAHVKQAQTVAKQQNIIDDDALIIEGFVYLAQKKLPLAQTTFASAIQSSPSHADAHLGASLVAMRNNQIEQALKSIAIAVTLEPMSASYMNYFGKILYASKRFDRATEVLLRSRELDPNDPTSLYLLAIIDRDKNRDGNAITLLNQAKKLNDKRAVYRSRYLLDTDLAVKNVDLSLALQQFNFNSWAQHKATAAIQQDRQNYSAHLLYAGSLNEQPGRDTVFASETLLARLLQPANANTFNDFNQYTALFERPDMGGSIAYGTGSFDQLDRELIVFGSQAKQHTAFQLSLSNSRSDGWRGTENEYVNSALFLGKWEPNEKHSFYLAYRDQTIDESDTVFKRFEYDSPSEPKDRRQYDTQLAEFGYNYKVSPSAQWLNYISYFSNQLEELDNSIISTTVGLSRIVRDTDRNTLLENDGLLMQSQFSSQNSSFSYNIGSLFYWLDTTRVDNNLGKISVFNNATGAHINTINNTTTALLDIDNNVLLNHHSGYANGYWQLSPSLLVEAGAYWDHFKNTSPLTKTDWSDTRLNPRLGITYQLNQNQTIRAAAYRYIFTLVPARIDPMEVAGLTLYRGNAPGSLVKESNLAWELEWNRGFIQLLGFYNETEWEGRIRLELISGSGILTPVPVLSDLRRNGIESNVNLLLNNFVGLTLNYNHAVVVANNQPSVSREEDLASLGFSFVHSSGITFHAEQMYRKLRYDISGTNDEYGITNLNLEYEFPRHLGRLTLEANNLQDKHFNWVTDSFVVDGHIPRRQLIARLAMYF